MSLRTLVLKQVQQAFIQLGDLAFPIDYVYHTGEEERDIESGRTIPVTRTYPVPRVVKAKFVEKEIDKNVSVATDMKFLMPRLDLNAAVNDPSAADVIVDKRTGRRWEVKRMLSDPADALLIYHVRTVR